MKGNGKSKTGLPYAIRVGFSFRVVFLPNGQNVQSAGLIKYFNFSFIDLLKKVSL